MTLIEARARHTASCEELSTCRFAYSELHPPLVSDLAYDSLRHEVIELEKRFPLLSSPGVSAPPTGITNVNKHLLPGEAPKKKPFRMPDTLKDLSKMDEAELHAYIAQFKQIRKKDFRQLLEDDAPRLPK